MIDWIDDLGKDWGRYLRRNPTGPDNSDSGFPATSVMGRIREEGSVGAAIRSHVQVIPVRDMPADILEFHRAWAVLKQNHKKIVYVRYAVVCPLYEKMEFLELKKRTFYSRLERAHLHILQIMDLQNSVQKVQDTQQVQTSRC